MFAELRKGALRLSIERDRCLVAGHSNREGTASLKKGYEFLRILKQRTDFHRLTCFAEAGLALNSQVSVWRRQNYFTPFPLCFYGSDKFGSNRDLAGRSLTPNPQKTHIAVRMGIAHPPGLLGILVHRPAKFRLRGMHLLQQKCRAKKR